MLKSFFRYATLIATAFTTVCSADCQTTFEIGVGYRRDFTKWDANTTDLVGDQLSSKLRLKDQDIVLIDARARVVEDWFYFRAKADYGWICNGKIDEKFTEIDLLGEEFDIHLDNKVKNGKSNVVDVIGAIGYPFEFCCGDFMVAPVVGYAYHYQHYDVDADDFVFTSTPPVPLVPTEDNHGKLTTKWYGPLIGVDLFWRVDECWNLWGEFQYIFAQCSRKRGTNIGFFGFDDFHKSTSANGFDGSVGADYFFCCDWYAGLSVDFSFWRSKKTHTDTAFKVGDTLHWDSVGVNLNVGYLF